MAREAGVSRAAASYVMNGRGGVSEETRARVLDAARRIGYQASRPARQMATGRAGAIGVALSPTRREGETPNYYVAELLAGVEEEARRAGYQVQVAMWTGEPLDMVREGSVEGLLFLGGAFPPDELGALALPWVLVGTSFPQLACDAVLADNRRGTYLATSHLLDAGCRRLALINGPSSAPTSDSKWLGFRDALRERNLPVDSFPVAEADFSPESGHDTAYPLLAGAEPPDGVAAGDDVIAIGVLHAAGELGIQVPGQLTVVGFGDSPTASLLRPALSSVRVFQRQMGSLGVRRLLSRLSGEEGFVQMLVEPQLVIRDSSRRERCE